MTLNEAILGSVGCICITAIVIVWMIVIYDGGNDDDDDNGEA